jgi:hypothetical protein
MRSELSHPSASRRGLWHDWQCVYSRREPPWIASWSWHALQAAVLTVTFFGYAAEGTAPVPPPMGATRSSTPMPIGLRAPVS